MTEPPPPAVLKPTRTIALVGLMGVGKTSVGKRLAAALGLPFRDADHEIELAAGQSVADIFADRGEAEFRDGERRVIARLLDDPPHVLATGGGAFVQDQTRAPDQGPRRLRLAEGRRGDPRPPGRPQEQPAPAGGQGSGGGAERSMCGTATPSTPRRT